jgi:hypothetical protein
MPKIDSSCDIFNKFIIDDLYSYKLSDTDSFKIEYANNSSFPITVKISEIIKIKNDSVPLNSSADIWYPIFIKDDSAISTKILSKYGAYKNANSSITSGRLGIENFISFSPALQSWSIKEGSAVMSIDWILNQPDIPFYLTYGIMGWYKNIPAGDQNISRPNNKASIDKFPIGSRLQSDTLPNVTLIKIDNNNLYRIDRDDHIVQSDQIVHFDSKNLPLVKLSDLGSANEVLFYLSPQSIKNNKNSIFGNESLLWIADGDCFSYFDNQQDQELEHQEKIISKTYISPALYSKYNQIYNIITSTQPKRVVAGMHMRQARLAKKLACILSTSPFISDSHINALNDNSIFTDIEDYINKGQERIETNTIEEINSLKKILLNISTYYNTNNLDSSTSYKTLTNNIVYSNKDLFNKLINKYSASLLFSSDTQLGFNKALKYGENIYIAQSIQNLCDKSLKGSSGTLKNIFNNQSILLDNIKIETAISEQGSDINLKFGQQNQKILPLSDIAKGYNFDLFLNISMESAGDVIGTERLDGIALDTKVVPLDGKLAIFETRKIETKIEDNPIKIPFSIVAGTSIADDPTEILSYTWEQLSGPRLQFSDSNYSTNTSSYFDKSTSATTIVYAKQTGEYTIQCTVATPYGCFIKKKTFYIVDGRQQYIQDGIKSNLVENGGTFGKYASRISSVLDSFPPSTDSGILQQDSNPIPLPTDYLRVMCPTLSEVAIEQGGLFWPMTTNCIYQLTTGNDFGEDRPLSGTQKFYFGQKLQTNTQNSNLTLAYKVNNTQIKLNKIRLCNIRNKTQPNECSNCLSMFEPIQYGSSSRIPGSRPPEFRQVVLRSEKFDNGVSLKKFIWNDIIKRGVYARQEQIFYYPAITTNNTADIKTYGGYGKKILSDLAIQIPHLEEPNELEQNIISTNPFILPPITGYNLAEKSDNSLGKPENIPPVYDIKLCYQKNIKPSGYIEFEKGVFHPSSGWIKNGNNAFETHKNLSSVLKFNPGARETFSFTGPGLSNMRSAFDRRTYASIPVSYKSSISLNMDPAVSWDPLCTCAEKEALRSLVDGLEKNNQLNKELTDQYIGGSRNLHHGYRYLAGGQPKPSEIKADISDLPIDKVDEFGFTASKVSTDPNSYAITYNYSFPVSGPANKITEENISNTNIRDPRINYLAIEDIEVKLNFLNYVNTKSLIVWLEMSPYEGQGNPNACPVNGSSNQFINSKFDGGFYNTDKDTGYPNCNSAGSLLNSVPNTGLIEYVSGLIQLNSSPRGEALRLCLLNQENIQNNRYNFSVKFSDHAPKNNASYDKNSINTSTDINLDQNIINDSYEIQPSISALNYSEKESIVYQNIIRKNQFNLRNNNFSKFKGHKLFEVPAPEGGCAGGASRQKGPSYTGTTTFTLHIMVLDEYDDMRSFDLVNNNNLIANYEHPEIRQKSSDIVNSLCSWELILHTNKTRKFTALTRSSLTNYGNTDSLGLIEYGNDPKYPGYNFIADLTDKKYLLPRCNLNAPYTYINDYPICDFGNPINKPKFSLLRAPQFPSAALVGIVAGTAGTSTGSALGTTTSPGAGYNAGFQALFDYFSQNRFIDAINQRAREIYEPKYENFPFGSAEKLLLNISKEGGIWYKLEAPIFKYKNSHVLEHNKYRFIKLSRKSMPLFSEFNFETIKVDDLIREDLISTTISNTSLADDTPISTIEELQTLDNVASLNNQSIFKVNFTQIDDDEKMLELNGLYLKDDSNIYNLSKNPLNMIKLNNLLQNNHLAMLFSPASQNLILINSLIPFYIFNIGDNIEHYKSSKANEASTAKVLGKGLVIKNNQYYTVLNLNTDISDSSIIAPAEDDTIVVFKPQTTKMTLSDYPINVWGLEKERIAQSTPELGLTVTGLGSYGDGSPFKNKEILSFNLNNNNLQNIYEILNHHQNDKLKFNNMTIFATVGEDELVIPVNNTDGAIGYACSIEYLKQVFNNDPVKVIKGSSDDSVYDEILQLLNNSTSSVKESKYEIIFIKCNNLSPLLLSTDTTDILHGHITFEQDYMSKIITNNLPQSDIDKLSTRLMFLEKSTITESLSNKIGKPDDTNDIINNGSILDIQEHYNALPNDTINCYQNITDNCVKHHTKQALYNRYNERNRIIQALEKHATKTINSDGDTTYSAHEDNSYILPQVRVSLQEEENGEIAIQYTNISDNYYWINIDPKQSCSLAEDATVKVLKKTTYTFAYANVVTGSSGTELLLNNNICPHPTIASFIKNGGIENFESSANSAKYIIPQTTIDKQKEDYKKLYKDIAGWKEYTIERRFTINDDTPGGTPTQDIEVIVTEVYDLALPCHMLPNANCGNAIKNDGSADTNFAVGSSAATGGGGCAGGGTAAGRGLLINNSSRTGIATRVYNIFNLDDINKLKVQFRKVPRQLRGIDYYTTVYRYGNYNTTFRPISSFLPPTELSIGDTLNNNFYCWECLQPNANGFLIKTTTTDFLKHQNEMIFRAFYGSVDGIEIKNDLRSLFPWEMIPYEYDT